MIPSGISDKGWIIMDNFRNVAVEAIGYIADRIDLLEREKPVSINFKEISMHRRHFFVRVYHNRVEAYIDGIDSILVYILSIQYRLEDLMLWVDRYTYIDVKITDAILRVMYLICISKIATVEIERENIFSDLN